MNSIVRKPLPRELLMMRPKRPRMTIAAIGFVATDGIVLCADSLECDGYSKKLVAKIAHYHAQSQDGSDWGIATVISGDGDVADSFNEELWKILGNSDFDERKLRSKVKNKLERFRKDYPDEPFEMLFGVFSLANPFEKWLHRFSRKALGPVPKYHCIGFGEQIANLICSQIYTPLLNVDEVGRLGILAILRAKEHAQYCGASTWVTSHVTGGKFWEDMPQAQVSAIEQSFNEESFREMLHAYWLAKTPTPSWPGGYRWLSGTGIKSRITLKLNTQR